MLAWAAVTVGAVLAVLGLAGLAGGFVLPGLGGRVEPRLDGLGHLLLAGCLLINGGRDAADAENLALGWVGTVLGVAGIVVLIVSRHRATRTGAAGRDAAGRDATGRDATGRGAGAREGT